MRKLLWFALLISLLPVTITMAADDDERRGRDYQDARNLPPAVQRTINELGRQGKIVRVRTLRVEGRTFYEVEQQVLIAENGSIIDDSEPQGRGESKGKGKAKGRDRDDRDEGSVSARNQPEVSRPPASTTNVPVVVVPATPPGTKVDQPPAVTVRPPPPVKEDTSRPAATTGPTAPATTTGPAVTTPALDPVQARATLEVKVRSLTRLDDNRAAADAGWNYVSQQGGVSYTTIQQQRKAFPTLAPAAALLGNLVSKQGGVPFSKVINERATGRNWGVLADQYKVPVEPLLQAVDGLEKAMEAAVPASRSATGATAEARAVLEQQVRTLTQLDNNPAAAAAGWNYVSQQGGVPYATIQQQRKAFPNLSPAAALLGNLVSKQGAVPFNKVTAERATGKQWGALAEQYKVSVESLSQAVAGLEKAMRDAVAAAKTK